MNSLLLRAITRVLSVSVGIWAADGIAREVTQTGPAHPPKYVLVTAQWPGASPEEIESEVATKLEAALQQLPAVKSVLSTSTDGRCVLRVKLRDKADDKAHARIGAAIARVRDFPAGMHIPTLEIESAGEPIRIAWNPDNLEAERTSVSAATLKRKLQMLQGVRRLNVLGLPNAHVDVVADPDKLRQYGVTLGHVIQAIQRQAVGDLPKDIKAGDRIITIKQPVRPRSLAQVVASMGEVTIRQDKSRKLTVKDVCRVQTAADYDSFALLNGDRVILFEVTTEPDREAALRQAIEAKLSTWKKSLQLGGELRMAFNVRPDVRSRCEFPAGTTFSRRREMAATIAKQLQRRLQGETVLLVLQDQPMAELSVLVKLDGEVKKPEAAVRTTRKVLAEIPGILAHTADLRSSAGHTFELRLMGPDISRLNKWARKATVEVRKIKGVSQATPRLTPMAPETRLSVDRERARAFGVTSADVANAVRRHVGPGEGITEGGHSVRVRIGSGVREPAEVANAVIQAPGGKAIRLAAVATTEMVTRPSVLRRWNGKRMVSVLVEVQTENSHQLLPRLVRRAVENARVGIDGQEYEFHLTTTSGHESKPRGAKP